MPGLLQGLYKKIWQMSGGTVYFLRDLFLLIVVPPAFAAATERMLMPGGRSGASSPVWQQESKPLVFVSLPSLAIIGAIFMLPFSIQEGAVSKITLAAKHRP